MTDLTQWLASVGLRHYADLFAKHEVDYETLLGLEEQDLEKLGIPLGHRKKLLKAIAQAVPASSRKQQSLAGHDEAAEKIGADRRHLTVLICDLVDSTALSARLDPEDLRQILHDVGDRGARGTITLLTRKGPSRPDETPHHGAVVL